MSNFQKYKKCPCKNIFYRFFVFFLKGHFEFFFCDYENYWDNRNTRRIQYRLVRYRKITCVNINEALFRQKKVPVGKKKKRYRKNNMLFASLRIRNCKILPITNVIAVCCTLCI